MEDRRQSCEERSEKNKHQRELWKKTNPHPLKHFEIIGRLSFASTHMCVQIQKFRVSRNANPVVEQFENETSEYMLVFVEGTRVTFNRADRVWEQSENRPPM